MNKLDYLKFAFYNSLFLLLLAGNCLGQHTQEQTSICRKGDSYCRIVELTGIINANPKVAENYLKRGNNYIAEENYFLALRDFNKAIELNPKYAEAYVGRGDIYFAEKDFKKALEEYDVAIKINPKCAEAYNSKGNYYSLRANYPKAIENYDKAIQVDPKNSASYHGIGYVNFYLKKYDLAIYNISRTVELEPDEPSVYASLATLYSVTSKKEELLKAADIAIKMCNKILMSEPNNYEMLIQRGLAYTLLNDVRGIDDYNNALSLKPDRTPAYKYLGIESYNNKKHSEAVKLYSRAIELNSEFAELYRYRAYAYEALGEKQKADADYKKYNQLSLKP